MLIPDLAATKEINLVRLYFERTVDNARYGLEQAGSEEEKKEATETLTAAQKALDEFQPSDDDPTITIGSIPPPKLTELRNCGFVSLRDEKDAEADKVSAEFLNRTAEISRQYIRWGVRGHANLSGVKFETEKDRIGSKEYEVASVETVYIYEGMSNGLYFNWIANEVIKFNTLDESKKKQSSQPAGTSPQTSTANSADKNPSSKGLKDATVPGK